MSEPVTIVVRRRDKAGSEKFADDFVGQKIQPFWFEEEARKLERPPAQTGGLIALDFDATFN